MDENKEDASNITVEHEWMVSVITFGTFLNAYWCT